MSQDQNREAQEQALRFRETRTAMLPTEFSMAIELAALREEVRLLRESLMPPKSILIVGVEVDRVMAILAAKSMGAQK